MSIYHHFTFNNPLFGIVCRLEKYSRTNSGKSWKYQPDNVTVENVSADYYQNYIQSIPFFANFGGFASCRAYRNYTAAGYIPVKVVTVSYDGKTKVIARFEFRTH